MRVYPAFGREVFFLFLLSGLLFLLVFFLFFLKKTRLSQVFFITMMLLGSVYSFVLMPLSAPDEVLHYVGAYELSSKMLRTPKPLYDHDGNLRIRKEDTEIGSRIFCKGAWIWLYPAKTGFHHTLCLFLSGSGI